MAFNEQSNKNKARIWTAVIHILLLLWFAFAGLKYQDPPPEEGIAINFGYEDDGSGTTSQATQSTPPPPTPTEPVTQTPAQEQVLTQEIEEAPVMESTEEVTTPTEEQPVTEPVEEQKPVTEPEPDPQPTPEELEQQRKQQALDRLFNTQNSGSGSGEGVTTGGGDQGHEDGSPNSDSRTGNADAGNQGRYRIKGTPKRIPNPEGCNSEGIVVIKIRVNSDGKVFEAELAPDSQIPADLPRSRFTNACLVQNAKDAAMLSTWSSDSETPMRVGFVVYKFELR